MLFISYRGIYDGQNFEDANTPDQIGKAFDHGFSVMADVWRVDNQIYLGNEFPLTPVTSEYLRGNRFWLNCRNDDVYNWVAAQPRKLYPNFFQFATDTESTPTDTSGGQTIVPGTVPINNASIVFLPELSDRGLLSTVKLRCYGICSVYLTFIRRMRNEGVWY